MRYFIPFVLVFMVFSCEKKQPEPVCKMLFKSVSVASQAVATALQCENEAQIAADLSAQITKLGLCDVTAQSALSDFLCPQVAQLVASLSVGALPTTWKCKAEVAGEIVKVKVSEACLTVIK